MGRTEIRPGPRDLVDVEVVVGLRGFRVHPVPREVDVVPVAPLEVVGVGVGLAHGDVAFADHHGGHGLVDDDYLPEDVVRQGHAAHMWEREEPKQAAEGQAEKGNQCQRRWLDPPFHHPS